MFAVKFNQIAFVLSPFISFVSSYNSKEHILDQNDEFAVLWGSFFDEFKCNRGFFSSQYYTFYFLRRLGYALSQIYLNSVVNLQQSLNVLGTSLILLHLMIYRPFKERSIMLSTVIGEIAILIVQITTMVFNFDLSDNTIKILEIVVMLSVLSAMGIQFIISLYIFIKSMILLWKKLDKDRSLKFAAVAKIVLSQNSEKSHKTPFNFLQDSS